MSSKLEPVIWLRDTGHIGIHGGEEGPGKVRVIQSEKLQLMYFIEHLETSFQQLLA